MNTPPRQPDAVIAQTLLAAANRPAEPITADEVAALQRRLAHAQRDSGQSRRVADFLLAWWNSASCGGFDLTSLWSLDAAILADMTVVFGLIGRINSYPDRFGYEADFKAIMQSWRPELAD